MNNLVNKALILGIGKTGLSCARYLHTQGMAFDFADTRQNPALLDSAKAEFPNADILLGDFTEALIEDVQMLVLSPGVDPRHGMIRSAYARGLDVVGDVELFAREVREPVVAITGSNGKSTVTELLGEMAKAAGIKVAVGGNLGTPALELLNSPAQLYVLELSSFQLETLKSLNPSAAVVLNVSEDHLDRYDSYTDYCFTKSRIYEHAKTSLINLDDDLVAAMPPCGEVKEFSIVQEPRAGQYGIRKRGAELWLAHGSDCLVPISKLKLQGRHNYANALAALALGDAIELSRPAMLSVLCDFAGLEHRTQWVTQQEAITYINDSKATNVGATVAAVLGINQPQVLIAGGVGKEQDFAPLANALPGRVQHVVLIGRDAEKLAQAIGTTCSTSFATNMQDAVSQAHTKAQAGSVVLLSPACASFDMYSGFEARGEDFVTCVHGLLEGALA